MDYTIAVTKDTTMTKWALLAPRDCFQNRKPIVRQVRMGFQNKCMIKNGALALVPKGYGYE
jgi:hypothetical protein